MSDLIAIVYSSPQRAHDGLAAMQRLEKAHLVDLADACVVTKDGDGRVRLHQSAAGAVSGALTDYGISDPFMRSLTEHMARGSSSIFVMVRRATVDKLHLELASFGGKLLHTSLSTEEEDRLRKRLATAPIATELPHVSNAVALPPPPAGRGSLNR